LGEGSNETENGTMAVMSQLGSSD